jgi:hypothetical protein
MNKIIDGMARALFVTSWADEYEENGNRFPPQTEIMDVAPPTPREAYDQAWRLTGMIESLNRMGVYSLFVKALQADKALDEKWSVAELEQAEKRWGDEFGHYLAMQAMGHGVSWFDNHENFNLKLPYFEYIPEGE